MAGTAEIIAVGSEMLTPDHVDTNSLFLTRKLNEIGIEVRFKTVVGDTEEDIAAVLHSALSRSDFIIFSGGLGPTEDDLTRPAVARVLGRALDTDPGILDALRARFASRGIRMAAINERQAQVIAGAEVLKNPRGTAPGMWIDAGNGRRIVLLPGPPRELMPMFECEVMPRLETLGGGRRLHRRSFSVVGMPESEVDSIVAPIYKAYSSIQTTILAAPGHIAIHLSRWAEPDEPVLDLEELSRAIQAALGNAVFTMSEEALEGVVGRLLRESGRTLSVAESCTSGMIGMKITRIAGSSEYFLGGILCYSNELKTSLCGVPAEVLERHGAVSAETAEALAMGVRSATQSSIGLSITGIAGPAGGTREKPVGLVYVGVSDGRRTVHGSRNLPGDRDAVRERAAFFALALLREFLMNDLR
jgi:nicotinamide-nucleotide amidase